MVAAAIGAVQWTSHLRSGAGVRQSPSRPSRVAAPAVVRPTISSRRSDVGCILTQRKVLLPPVEAARRVAVAADVQESRPVGAESGEEEPAVPEYAVIMKVRDSELDQYSVVNNSVYNNYLQHARHMWLEHIGGDPDEVARSGDALALSTFNISYRQPLRSRDTFVATVSVGRYGLGPLGHGMVPVERITGARVTLNQQIRRTSEDGDELVLEAEAVIVWLDKDYRPKRIPKYIIGNIKGFTESMTVHG